LTVLVGVRVLQHPQSITTKMGSNITFTVVATNNSPITYQWRKDGVNIPGANGAAYNIPSVRYEDRGVYDVLMTDQVGTIPSLPATMVVLMDPTIVLHPIAQGVPAGSTVTLSVGVTNVATLPITYRWRKGNGSIATNTLNSYFDYYTINNVQGGNFSSNIWDCIITNPSKPTGLQTARVPVYAIADSDGDGIPDDWEIANGFDPNSSADALLDSDGDGMKNRDEYIAGTDPHNPLSYLKVDSITPQGGASLNFQAVSNRTYSVLYSDSLPPTWAKLISVPARATNWSATVTDPSGRPTRYYRLQTPLTP